MSVIELLVLGELLPGSTRPCAAVYIFFKKRFLILNSGFTWPVAVWFSRRDSDGKSTVGTRRLPFFLQCNKTSPAPLRKNKLAPVMSPSVLSEWPGCQVDGNTLGAEPKTSVK